MSFATRTRLVNPRLGTYFSIFAALFAAIFLLSLISEMLDVQPSMLRLALFAAPVVLYAAIGIAAGTNDGLGYFAAGRRVPAGYTGLLIATTAMGATMYVSGTGAAFFAGFDALVLMIGGLTGLVFMAMLLAPFYRKFGAYTVPSYLGRRFDSKSMRLVAALASALPMLLILSAELKLGAGIASRLAGFAFVPGALFIAVVAAVSVAPGGMRSFTWSGVAQSVAALIALFAVLTVVSTLATGLPIPQLAHGPLVRGLVRNEIAQGLQTIEVWPLAFQLPPEGFTAITKPYTQPFGSVGPLGFVLGTLMIAFGIAAAPWLLPRVAAAPGVYEARKSLGWAVVLFGVLFLTMSAAAVFLRDSALDAVSSDRIGPPPKWLFDAAQERFVAFDTSAARLAFDTLQFDRDAVLFALPSILQLPAVFSFLLMAGAVSAALAASGAHIAGLAAIFAEDVVHGLSWETVSPQNRVWITRIMTFVAAGCGAAITILAPADPLQLFLWSLALTGSSLFPVLTLSIWWKRLTPAGAIAGVATGAGVATLAIVAGENGAFFLPGSIAGCLGFPASMLVAIIVSAVRPEASRHALGLVRDIRIPGGQILYDRALQRQLVRRQSRG